jgi:5'-nucleotidase
MRILLTNDDGIDAPGLAALSQAAAFAEFVVAAPEDALSGCSHRVTTHGPIRVTSRGEKRYAVAGTPADCVRIGLQALVPDAAWILAGINAGGNLGADVWHSGTVAAVREAVLHGLPGIAVSQYHKKGRPFDWQQAAAWARPVLEQLMKRPVIPGSFWNVNLPHLEPGSAPPPVVYCRLDPSPLPLRFRETEEGWCYEGNYHERRREDGADVDVCFRGNVAVTQVTLL